MDTEPSYPRFSSEFPSTFPAPSEQLSSPPEEAAPLHDTCMTDSFDAARFPSDGQSDAKVWNNLPEKSAAQNDPIPHLPPSEHGRNELGSNELVAPDMGLSNHLSSTRMMGMNGIPTNLCPTYNPMSMMGNAYDMAGYHSQYYHPAATPTHRNPSHHNLIPLGPPPDFMRPARSVYPMGSGGYSLIPPSNYFDYSMQARGSSGLNNHMGQIACSIPAGQESRSTENIAQLPHFGNAQNQTVPTTLQSGSPPLKRPRGRPRKHPLPIPSHHHLSYYDHGESAAQVDQLQSPASRCSRASMYLDAKRRLHNSEVLEKLQAFENLGANVEIAEEYFGFGGPYTWLATSKRIDAVLDSAEDEQYRQEQGEDVTPSHVVRSLTKDSVDYSLNSSFMWSTLDLKVPVRDLVVSRHHMAALLNDSSVFVYRHKTEPLVRTNVNRWERISALDGMGIVALKLASGHFAPDWRKRYHATKRVALIKKIREELQTRNVQLPPPMSDSEVSAEELEVFVAEHPQGILCCSTESMDPDWLPDPVALAAIDQGGVVRVAQCCGYYNYPSFARESVEVPAENEIMEDKQSQEAARSTTLKFTQTFTATDHIEKQSDLSLPTNALNEKGQPIKVRAQVQDVSLGELTEDSLANTPLEIAIVLYALGNKEHSAFVRGKNLYIRFKNFPTGPAKLHCGPLGHTGAVLLANGTVWSWAAQPKGPGSGNGKLGVVIAQVAGSLKGRTVIDLMAVGAEFLALTADGVVHEWNSYAPYFSGDEPEKTVPLSSERPWIPEPIEWTPDFQKKLSVQASTEPRVYKVGQFNWFGKTGVPAAERQEKSNEQREAVAESLKNESEAPSGEDERCMTTSTGSGDETIGDSTTQQDHEQTNVQMEREMTDNNLSIEDELEKCRQTEISKRYGKDGKRVERIFLTEGVTFLLRNCTYEIVENDLNGYLQTSGWKNYHFPSIPGLTVTHAKAFTEKFAGHGRPLTTNPVVVARMKLSNNSSSDDQLRLQLETMASTDPPPYRLLVSPISLVAAVLTRVDMTTVARDMLMARLPLSVVADDPNSYLQALSSFRAERAGQKRRKQEDWWQGSESSDGTRQKNRRGRGRVGRPRGSRAGVRASLSSRHQSRPVQVPEIIKEPEETTTTNEMLPSTIEEPEPPTGPSAGTRKRNRRHSAALDEEQFFTGFADSSDSDKAWEQILQMLDEEEGEGEGRNKKRKGRYRRRTKEDGNAQISFVPPPQENSATLANDPMMHQLTLDQNNLLAFRQMHFPQPYGVASSTPYEPPAEPYQENLQTSQGMNFDAPDAQFATNGVDHEKEDVTPTTA